MALGERRPLTLARAVAQCNQLVRPISARGSVGLLCNSSGFVLFSEKNIAAKGPIEATSLLETTALLGQRPDIMIERNPAGDPPKRTHRFGELASALL